MIGESRATFGGVGTRVLSVNESGTPIVLLHGYGDSADTWRAVLTNYFVRVVQPAAIATPAELRAAPGTVGWPPVGCRCRVADTAR